MEERTAKYMAITRDVRTFVLGLEAGRVANRTRQDIPGRENSTSCHAKGQGLEEERPARRPPNSGG